MERITLAILLDAFRADYLDPEDTPYLWQLKDQSVYIKNLHNPGGYCERSVFMTGAYPDVTDNYFAMAMMPVGYKRPEYEPQFNVPRHVRDRLVLSEDHTVDFSPGSFINFTTGKTIESFWDVMRDEVKDFAVEACVALGIKSWRGRTTHGSRPIHLLDKIKRGTDFAYIQFSETDQIPHYRGTDRKSRKWLLSWVDSQVEMLVNETKKQYKEVNVIVFGDHGMDDIKKRVDLPLEYPPYKEGWDYLYLKSSAAIQFWTFDKRVEKHILNDPKLKQHGEFIKSPSQRQGDIVWRANYGTLVSPCHFHDRNDPIKAMHGWDSKHPNMQGMAIIHDGKTKKEIKQGELNDICSAVCDLVGISYPKYCQGKSYL